MPEHPHYHEVLTDFQTNSWRDVVDPRDDFQVIIDSLSEAPLASMTSQAVIVKHTYRVGHHTFELVRRIIRSAPRPHMSTPWTALHGDELDAEILRLGGAENPERP